MSALWREGRKGPYGACDGHSPPPTVHFNFTSFKTTTNLNESPKVKHVLVIVDHFMRYTRAYVTKDQKASTTAKTHYEGLISIFRALERILIDQGESLHQ